MIIPSVEYWSKPKPWWNVAEWNKYHSCSHGVPWWSEASQATVQHSARWHFAWIGYTQFYLICKLIRPLKLFWYYYVNCRKKGFYLILFYLEYEWLGYSHFVSSEKNCMISIIFYFNSVSSVNLLELSTYFWIVMKTAKYVDKNFYQIYSIKLYSILVLQG